jgi:hypothetical protein
MLWLMTKRSIVLVLIMAFVGIALGVAGGIAWAAMSECDPGDVGSCYGFFGRAFSDTSYFSVIGGLVGLGTGLALALLILAARRLFGRHQATLDR